MKRRDSFKSTLSTLVRYLYLKRDPMRMNPELAEFLCTGPLSLKNAWCSTAHFHRCLQALGWSILKTKVCSCSLPWGADWSMSDPGGQPLLCIMHMSEWLL